MVWHRGSGERTTWLHSAASCPALRKWAQDKYYLCLRVSQILLHRARAAKQSNPGLQTAAKTLRDSPGFQFRGPTLPSPRFLGRRWVLPQILGVTHGSGTGGHGPLRTQTDPGLLLLVPTGTAAGASPAHDRLTARVQVTDFIFSAGNEIQSHTNNCVCFPYGFQSGIASYWKSQILIKFASCLIFNATGCKFFSWRGGANLNTWV